jgi:hypothetical protein
VRGASGQSHQRHLSFAPVAAHETFEQPSAEGVEFDEAAHVDGESVGGVGLGLIDRG